MRSRLGMSAYYKKRRVGGRTSHLARGDRVPIHLLTYLRHPVMRVYSAYSAYLPSV